MPNPPEIPIPSFPTADIAHTIVVELVDTKTGKYVPIPVGTRRAEGADGEFAGYELVHQRPTEDFRWVQRFWANAPVNQDVFNAAISYLGDSASHPIYLRSYVERRPHTSRTRALPLTAVVSTTVTSGGTNYTTAPTVTAAGGGGTGFSATALIYRGSVIGLRITSEGTGYTSAPILTLTGGGGTGATATAALQPAAAVLTSEEVQKLPEDDPRHTLYDRVIRLYETLPGPYIPDAEWNDDLGYVQLRKRAVLNTGQVGSQTAAGRVTYKARDESSIVVWEIEESWTMPGTSFAGKVMSDAAQGAIANTTRQILAAGTAAPTIDWKTLEYRDVAINATTIRREITTLPDAAFPIVTDYDQDPEMLSLIRTTVQVVQASAVAAPSITTGVRKRFKSIDKWRSFEIIEYYSTPASYSEQKFAGQNFPSLFTEFYHSDACGVILRSRASFSAMVEIRLDISFGAFSAVSGLTLIPNTFAIANFRVSDILHDDILVESTEPGCSYSEILTASSPSKTAYLAYGTTKQRVSGECVLWKAGIFRKTELYVRML